MSVDLGFGPPNAFDGIVGQLSDNVFTDQDINELTVPKCSANWHSDVDVIIPALDNPASYVCPICSKSFVQKQSLTRHIKTHNASKRFRCDVCQMDFIRREYLVKHKRTHESAPQSQTFTCEQCNVNFSRKDNYTRHMRSHYNPHHKCPDCDLVFARHSNLLQHKRVTHTTTPFVSVKRKASTSLQPSKRVCRSQSALGVFSTHAFDPTTGTEGDLKLFMEELHAHLVTKLHEELDEKGGIKWYAVLKVNLIRISPDGEEDIISPYFRSKCHIDLLAHTIDEHINEAWAKIEASFEEFVQRGSGWRLSTIKFLELNVTKYNPL